MKAIDTKLWRDILRLKGQVLTIALVVAAGIASYVTMRSAWASMESMRSSYYEGYRFADAAARSRDNGNLVRQIKHPVPR